MPKFKYICPECGSSIVAWADLDAEVTFNVNKSGELTSEKIENVFQSDARCGVQCSDCDWESDDISDESDPFFQIANEALKRQQEIKLLSVKCK